MENSKVKYTSEISKFKQKYITDENFRTKHKAILNTKVICPECGYKVSRSNMNHHKSTKWHIQLINERQVKQEIEKLKAIIEQLKNSATTEQYENILLDV